MVVKDTNKNYIFPRVPINIEIPEDYPDIGEISNISVIPQLSDYSFNRGELELWGSYQVIVSYKKSAPQTWDEPAELCDLSCDEFFSHLRLQADGLFTEEPHQSNQREAASELYTIQFTRPLHTYVSQDAISKPRFFRPLITVERIEAKTSEKRKIKAELVLALINRTRRGNW